MNWELPDVQAGFWKGRRTRDQIANIQWIIAKAREFQKTISVQFSSGSQSCPTLCEPMDCLLHPWDFPGKNTGVGCISFSRGSSQPRDRAQVSHIAGRCFTLWATWEAPEKAEEPEIILPTSTGLQKKQRNSRKTSTSASLTMLKPLTVWIRTNCAKFLKRWQY